MAEKKLSLAGGKLQLGNIDASQLRGAPSLGDGRRTVQVEVRRRRNTPVFFTWGEVIDDLKSIRQEAIKTGSIIAGITEDDLEPAPLTLKRTEVIKMIPRIRMDHSSKYANTTILSRDLGKELKEPSDDLEALVFNAAFPNHDVAGLTTLCTRIGGRLIINFLSIFGEENYIDGNFDLQDLMEWSYADDPRMDRVKKRAGKIGSLRRTYSQTEGIEPEPEPEPIAEPEKYVHQRKQTSKVYKEGDQAIFRQRLLESAKFKAICQLTGITEERFLVASHIRPKAECENRGQVVDSHNGILLSPNADHLFDRGYISFQDDGTMKRSSKLGINGALLQMMGIKADKKITVKSDRMREYLKYHRENVFEGPRTKEKSNG